MDDRVLINDFARRSFRDIADQDYISARVNYQANLPEPFLWCSLQAIEKYLKAILLFNDHSAKNLSHDLERSLSRVLTINDIDFDIPDDVKHFIRYLNTFGANRYLEYSTYMRRKCLFELDKTVWHIRRYCYFMRGEIKVRKDLRKPRLPFELKRIHKQYFTENPHKYSLFQGYLENAIKKNKEAAKWLVWHNFYFGRRKKNFVKKHPEFLSSVNTTLTLHPEAYDVLKPLVNFSKRVRQLFDES